MVLSNSTEEKVFILYQDEGGRQLKKTETKREEGPKGVIYTKGGKRVGKV